MLGGNNKGLQENWHGAQAVSKQVNSNCIFWRVLSSKQSINNKHETRRNRAAEKTITNLETEHY